MNCNRRKIWSAAGIVGIALLTACSPTAGEATVVPSAQFTATVTVTTTLTPESASPTTVTVTAAAGGFSLPSRKVFDEAQVAQGVSAVLTGNPPTGYGLTGVTDVQCPAHQPVEAGTSFRCTLAINGVTEEATVLVKDNNGLYEVNPPS
jgi:hypothetical protein